ncbi:unnamed protein product [Scytosiphon promiscuus]
MEQGYLEQQAEKLGDSVELELEPSPKSIVNTKQNSHSAKPPTLPERGGIGTPGRRSSGGGGVRKGNRGVGTSSAGNSSPPDGGGGAGRVRSTSPGSPPMGFSPLPPKHALHDYEDFNRRRMTSRAGPLSPNRGSGLSGGEELRASEAFDRDGQIIRRDTGIPGTGLIENGDSCLRLLFGRRNMTSRPSQWSKIPSPARAAELEAEVSFLNRQLSVRHSLEERLRATESDKARLITKLATAQADAARRAENLERMLQEMTEKLAVAEEQKLGDAEERAMTAQRDLRLSREALRVKSDLAKAADTAAGAKSLLSLSPGSAGSRFPASNHDMPLAASPALRAPPPVSWGSGPTAPEMGVRFALDTLRYSEDEEVVVFMLHLVQGLRHEAHAASSGVNPASRGNKALSISSLTDPAVVVLSQGGGTPPTGAAENSSSLARVLFKPSSSTSTSGKSQVQNRRSGGGGGDRELSQLALLLISRACENEEVANFLFWYLKLEAEGDPSLRAMYVAVRKALMDSLTKQNAPFAAALKASRLCLTAAEAYMAAISTAHGIVKKKGGRAPAKTARLKAALTEKNLHVVPDLAAPSADGG